MVSASAARWIHWLVPLLVAFVTLTAFLPALQNGFVNWDDDINFLRNVHYRGLGPSELRWMFTTSIGTGQWIPLTWLTLGLDYILWGMRPAGYHLTNVLLHAANASVFFFVVLRLLTLALPGPAERGHALAVSAGFAALVFAIHPLRVESVAWVTERRDVLSGLLFLLTLFSYLRAADGGGAGRGRWLVASVGFYALALAAKAVVVTLPLLLVVLDVYPLRRLPDRWRDWLAPAERQVWAEKVPYGLLALVASGIAAYALRVSTLAPDAYPLWAHVFIGAHGLCFYVWKTLFPLGLSPLYELPARIDPLDPALLGSVVAVVGIGAGVWALRRRWPAGLAACAAYVVLLAPVSGLPRTIGPQLVATRYSYLSCLPWAILAGAALLSRWRAWERSKKGRPTTVLRAGIAICTALCVVVGLGVLTWNQVHVWHDSEMLWTYALAIDPSSSYAHTNLGIALAQRAKFAEAIEHYRRALQLEPGDFRAQSNWGLALAQQGNLAEAIEHYRQALQLKPDYGLAQYSWGLALAQQGNLAEAIEHYRQALQLKPDNVLAHINWGLALAHQGNLAEAIEHYRQALQLKPDNVLAHINWGLALAHQGNPAEAIEHYRQALHIEPDQADAHNNWGVALARQGDLEEAIEHFQQALRIEPDYAPAHANLARAFALQGKPAEASEHHQQPQKRKKAE